MNQAKELKQEQALQHYINSELSPWPYKMIFYKATGTGKTKVAIDCAMWYLDHKERGDTLFVCHSTDSRDRGMPEELSKWAKDHFIVDFTQFICYDSLHHIKGQHFAVLIMDEAHYLTLGNSKFLKENTFGSIILLTAEEPPQQEKKTIIKSIVGTNHFRLPVDEAVALGIVNSYKIFVMQMELDDTVAYLRGFKKDGSALFTERMAYLKLCKHLQTLKDMGRSDLLGQTYGTMMKFMGSCRSKTMAMEYVMNQFRKHQRRFMAFGTTIEQVSYLSPFHMHSQIDDRWLQSFIMKATHEIVSIVQLKESVNAPDTSRAVIAQVNTNYVNTIQFVGRTLRLDPSDQSNIVILCFKNTFDEGWLNKALSRFDPANISYNILEKEKYWQAQTDYKMNSFL